MALVFLLVEYVLKHVCNICILDKRGVLFKEKNYRREAYVISQEIRFTGRNILVHLSSNFGCDHKSIRALCRSVRYQRELNRVRADVEEAAPDDDAADARSSHEIRLRLGARLQSTPKTSPSTHSSNSQDYTPSSPQPTYRLTIPPPPGSPDRNEQNNEDDPVAIYLRTLLADPATDPEKVSLLTPILTNPPDPAATHKSCTRMTLGSENSRPM